MKQLKVLILMLMLSTVAHAQQPIKKFSEDKDKYVAELQQYMEIESKKAAEEFMLEFQPFWNSPNIPDDYRFSVYTLSNLMLKKKIKPFPQFVDFFKAFRFMVQSNRSLEEYNSWHDACQSLVQRTNTKAFLEFLEMTNNLFTDNTIFNSQTTTWKADNNKFVFKYDSVPKVVFDALTLKCVKYGDSALIYNTKGVYFPKEGLWLGQGGVVDWRRAGQSPDSVYATIGKYKIEMKSSNYKADSVVFYYKKLFKEPMKGVLEDKIMASVNKENATFPRFESYDKRLFVKNIFQNIDYEGGFRMTGGKFYASGTAEQKARIIFNSDSGMLIMCQSKSFVIKSDRVSSDNAEFSIYLDKDSIFHPMIEMKYLDEKKELSLLRGEEGLSMSPFYDSYHMVDLYVEAIYWKTNEPLMKFAMFKGVKTESEAIFESFDYYSQYRFDKLRGMAEKHPFIDIIEYTKKVGSRTFEITGLANYMRLDPTLIEAFIVNITNKGYLRYNFDTKEATVMDRMIHYNNSRMRKTDYDIIQFNSVVSKQQYDYNASMNLLNNEMTIQGVSQVVVSDSHNVVLYPYHEKIVLRKNRDFDFQGKIDAGLFEYYGKDFNFVYDEFKINLNNVDSFTFSVPGTEIDPETGEKELVRIRTMIEGVSGDLQIDKPSNKSGLKPFRNYPIFNSKKDSYAFYDRPQIYGGVYNRENFFYQLDPFSFDSIDKFQTSGIKFSGSFASAGIFPDFDDDLTVMPDYSLGFTRKTPPGGFPTYEGKGQYEGGIALSNEGLHGEGLIKYITSTSKSNDFTFFPDSTNGSVFDFDIKEVEKEEPQYPTVTANNVRMHWVPYDDYMQDIKVSTPLNFFNNQCVLHGVSHLTPNGLSGKGRVEFPTAYIDADLFKFKHHEFDTDTCAFTLKVEGSAEAALATVDYNGHVDLNKKIGHFKANSSASKVDFPINQYVCYMDEFNWAMDKSEIELFTSEEKKLSGDDKQITLKDGTSMSLSGSQFVSVHPAQDSLRFFAPRAKYDIKNNIINAYDVKFILVADAAIFPDSGHVQVLKRAEMKALENARVIANTATKYHDFYKSKVYIYARRKYEATGYYDYTDEADKKQQLFFEKIGVDTTFQTYGQGTIAQERQFTLSPYYDYYGKVNLKANREVLNFDGNVRIKHTCKTVPINWMNFESEINPKEIYIPVSGKPKDQSRSEIFAGIMQGKDSSAVYSAFLSREARNGDDTVLIAKGYLYYDKETKEFRISEMARIKENKFTGNYLSLNTFCDVYAEGKMALSTNVGQVKLNTYGAIVNKTKKDETTMDVVMSLDFFFAEKAMKIIEDFFVADATAQPANLNSEIYYKALTERVGQAQADKLISELNVNGSFKKLPDELIHTFYFTDLSFKWNNITNSYVSQGGLVGIASINKTQLNKKYKAYFEIEKKKSGDILNIYFEDANKNWVFFNYGRGIMQTISSSKEYNAAINDMKPDDRTMKTEKGQQPYYYQISSEKKKRDFLKSMGLEE